MIPLQQAQELKSAISEYLKATFTFREKNVNEEFHRFVNDPKQGLFKGPYVSLQLPYKKADESEVIPLEITPPFTPFLHQFKSFHRLFNGNEGPKPTLLTTGTGSGKTESFLYPILDYCYKNRDRSGIKAIILYPMNALATDQAQRLAETIWKDPKLKGNITAGLFIGTGMGDKKYPSVMGADHIIEDRDRIIDVKPDILLTNFKMLDYGLMRNRYHKLWSYNFEDSDLLKFLVLDELHTYDGAQGTDVANLIRRLKLKLGMKPGGICPVGTSATIGEGEESIELLTGYAEKVFGESFPPESVITEERVSVEEFIGEQQELKRSMPGLEKIEASTLKENDEYHSYIKKQLQLWGLDINISPFDLGVELKKLQIFHDLLAVTTASVTHVSTLVARLAAKNIRFKDLSEWDEEYGISPRYTVLESLLALITYSKSDPSAERPFLFLRTQIWVRELSGIMRVVDATPVFTWRDKKEVQEMSEKSLPMYFCRECGASGWLSKKRDNHEKFESDSAEIFQDYFTNHKNIYFINTDTEDHQPIEEYNPTNLIRKAVSKETLEISNRGSDEKHVPLVAVRKLNERGKSDHLCPECGAQNTLSIIGMRMTTMSSVGVSQTLSSNLDGKEEGYRKLLAFTNSVQDAAHQAGFIEARNYRFMFRTSLQQVLNDVDDKVSLVELAEEFKAHWKRKGDNEETYYYRFYPEDCAKKAPIEEYRIGADKPFTDRFKEEFDLRMDWEVLSEYGFNTLIGRTLEKTGSSTIWVPEEIIESLYPKMKPWMDNNLMESVSDEELKLFVSGLIYRLRVRGGIDHRYLNKFREDETTVWNLNWLRDNRHFLNKSYHERRSRFPKILTTAPHQSGIMDTTFTKYQNWYHYYFKKSFQLVVDNISVRNEFFEQLFEVLSELGVVNKKYAKNEFSYALNPEVFRVSRYPKIRECDACGHRLTTAELDPYLGYSKCQQYRCSGSYSREVKQEFDYYNKVFNRKYSPRVISREHTGVLDRDNREQLEDDFKSNQIDRSVNALVATSTLEMGIDIGQLDSSFNLGMPPLPSNFMQRIGRAGRKSGSSFISNFVSQRNPHDLYYFEAPLEMMDGEIHTPGCFLNAPEILQRQFLAHCIDRWVMNNPEANTIPYRISFLKLPTSDLRDSELFLNKILSFIDDHLDHILSKLREVYKPELEEEQLVRLKEIIEVGQFSDWLFQPFYSLKDRFKEIENQRIAITEYINERNLAAADPERISLEENKKSLYKTRKKLEQQQVLEFMTYSGLLPNYAFPDQGVSFSGRIFQPVPKGSNGKPQNFTKEYVRPASLALKEFAPHNTFFAEGYKFSIQGLMTHEWGGQRSTLEELRFCSNCDHLEISNATPSTMCPKCGDPSFGAASNVHSFAKMTGAKSEVLRDKAALDDSSDERNSTFYTISKHVQFDSRSSGALALVDIPFGIELAKNVELTEVNLGLIDTVSSTKIKINDHDGVPRHGFVTCKTCGYSTNTPSLEADPNNRNKYKFHFPYCKHRSVAYSGETGDIFEEVYLYRNQKTEVLKILIPVQTFATEEYKQIFKAGLELGLKEFYKGNPAHLSFLDYREFNAETAKFDQYLLLYDIVPGGTGYLSKLYDKATFTEILKKSYHKIKHCTCQYEDKDGCYHCVYSYRNQYISSVLSRSKAEELFGELLKHSSNWKSLDHSLSDVTKTGKIEESELEERFIYALERWAKANKWEFQHHQSNNVRSYYMTIPLQGSEDTITYWIKPQVTLGNADGVAKSTRPDFLFKPVETTGHDEDAFLGLKEIAVYLDGYQFHASNENNRFQSDIEKRKAIIENGRYRVWTFTWEDVDEMIKSLDDPHHQYHDALSPNKEKYRTTTDRLRLLPQWQLHEHQKNDFDHSFSRFLALLRISEERQKKSIAIAAMRCLEHFPFPNMDTEKAVQFLNREHTPKQDDTVEKSELGSSSIKSNWSVDTSIFDSKVVTQLSKSELSSKLWYKPDGFQDIEKEYWNTFWALWNLLQYGDFDVSDIHKNEESGDPEVSELELLQVFDENLHGLVKSLIAKDIPFDLEGSFILKNDSGFIEANLGFETNKVVFNPLSDMDRKGFENLGYEIADPDNFDINRLKR